MVPDIDFPSLFDSGEIGESALDHALDWDQISAVRHREYGMFETLLPTLETQHRKRVADDPNFVYLTDQVAMSMQTRGLKALPLNEQERIELRDSQEQQALEIENKRRIAQGLTPLESLRDEEDMVSLDGADDDSASQAADVDDALPAEPGDTEAAFAEAESEQEEDPDVLLLEAGRILADTLALTSAQPVTTVTAQR